MWITLLAAMDRDGYAHFSAIGNLASRARVTEEEAEKAIACFLASDSSGDQENEGRRVERVPGGFFIINAAKHRGILNKEMEREQTRLRVSKHRKSMKNKNVTVAVTPVTVAVTPVTQSNDIQIHTQIQKQMQKDLPLLSKKQKGGGSTEPEKTVLIDDSTAVNCPHQEVIALYHKHLPMCPAVRIWDQRRRTLLKQRWVEDKERQDLEWWQGYFEHVATSAFLTGGIEGSNGRPPFVATLEWLLRPSNLIKVYENQYHDKI